jgi:hypothetical protein
MSILRPTLAALLLLAAACGGASGQPAAAQPAAADSRQSGDIPDTQAYVDFTPPGGTFSVKVPEGWARTESAGAVTFTDKLDSVRLQSVPAAAQPTVDSARASELPAIRAAAQAFRAGDVTTVTRTAGTAVLVTYQADSAIDPVTGKAHRDDVQRYELWRNGMEALVVLSAPAGADNVDPWRTITDSFRWR